MKWCKKIKRVQKKRVNKYEELGEKQERKNVKEWSKERGKVWKKERIRKRKEKRRKMREREEEFFFLKRDKMGKEGEWGKWNKV